MISARIGLVTSRAMTIDAARAVNTNATMIRVGLLGASLAAFPKCSHIAFRGVLLIFDPPIRQQGPLPFEACAGLERGLKFDSGVV